MGLVYSWGLWNAVSRPTACALLRRIRGRILARADRLLELLARNPAESPSQGK